MISGLTEIAQRLDSQGLFSEASELDQVAGELMSQANDPGQHSRLLDLIDNQPERGLGYLKYFSHLLQNGSKEAAEKAAILVSKPDFASVAHSARKMLSISMPKENHWKVVHDLLAQSPGVN